jgi:hypothetical protein
MSRAAACWLAPQVCWDWPGGAAVYAAAIEPDGLVVTRYAPALPGWPTCRKLSVTVIAFMPAVPTCSSNTSAASSNGRAR